MGFALRGPILWASQKPFIKRTLTALPLTRAVVRRFVAGEHLSDAVRVAGKLRRDGILISIDHLGEDVTHEQQVAANIREAEDLVGALRTAGLAEGSEISIKLSALGQALDDGLAYRSVLRIARAAHAARVLLSIDMEDHTTTDRTLATVRRVRGDVPSLGVAIQALLRRTPRDLADLREAGSRVRLVKGAYDEPIDVAVQSPNEVEAAYTAALEQLFTGAGYPMVGTHSPALIQRALELAAQHGKGRDDFELQMLYGIRSAEQRRLAAEGYRVRAYVPYGTDWYGYLTRRLAEKPSNLMLFLRALRPERDAPKPVDPESVEAGPANVQSPAGQQTDAQQNARARSASATATAPTATAAATTEYDLNERASLHEGTGHGRPHISPDTQ